MKQYPSQARLRELFDYDPEGFLVWRYREDVRPCVSSRMHGKRAGSVHVDRDHTSAYQCRVDGRDYSGGRLIWTYFKGDVPEGKIVRRVDAEGWFQIENLCIADNIHSKTNRRAFKSKNKYLGVYKKKTSHGWNVDLHNKPSKTFITEDSAAVYYDNHMEDHGRGRPNGTVRLDTSAYEITKSLARYLTGCAKVKKEGRMIGVYSHKNGYDFVSRCAGINIKGRFSTKEQAARAYNIAAREHYGEIAVLNDIPDPLGTGEIF